MKLIHNNGSEEIKRTLEIITFGQGKKKLMLNL